MIGGELKIANVNTQIQKIFEMSGLLRLIPVEQKNKKECNMTKAYDNEMKIEFLSKSKNEAFARIAVAAFIAQLDPTVEEVADIKTAVSEAVTNAIIHGYEEKIGIVKLICKIAQNEVFIEISDSGKGIENIEEAKQPLFTTKSNLERSGMGFTIMESFMDNVEVDSVLGVGTKVTMSKKIKINSSREKQKDVENANNLVNTGVRGEE